jgi:hypothetical protein
VKSAESLFRDFFLPLYPEDAKSDLGRARAEDANPAGNPNVLGHLEDAARVFVEMAPVVLGAAPETLALDFTDASVHRLSAALTTEQRDRLVAQGKGADNALFNFVVHGAAYVGACVVRAHGGVWSVRRPLWESIVRLRSRAGDADLPIFHWWLKSLADPAGEDAATLGATLADRYRAHVEVPCARPEELPVIAPADRELPRLAKVRYDAFYKYLRARLPELRDVGEAFPSPERFAELGFDHLDFALLGGGRMLLVHGPTKHGLHAFWLTKEGFEKGAFWPADAFPKPLLRVKRGKGPEGGPPGADERIEVVLSRDGNPVVVELLWWGP